MEERRKLGLCYYCDDKRQLGLKYKRAKLFLLEWLIGEVEHKSRVQFVELDDEGVVVGHQNQVQVNADVVPLLKSLYMLW